MNKLQEFIQKQSPLGFLTEFDIQQLTELDRLCPVLVRCGGGRFTCGAQDVPHFVKCVEAGGDYIRDASLPVGAMDRAAAWKPDCVVTGIDQFPMAFTAPRPPAQVFSPEVSGPVRMGLDGKAHLTPKQVEQLSTKRFSEWPIRAMA